VHSASATGDFVRKLGLESTTTCSNPEQIAAWLVRLSRTDEWTEGSVRSLQAFEMHGDEEAPADKLKRSLDRIA
jgi:hypothetical protein